jgi:hypothetical protein
MMVHNLLKEEIVDADFVDHDSRKWLLWAVKKDIIH